MGEIDELLMKLSIALKELAINVKNENKSIVINDKTVVLFTEYRLFISQKNGENEKTDLVFLTDDELSMITGK